MDTTTSESWEAEWTTVLQENRIPAAERQKRCGTCWRGLSRCSCQPLSATVAEVLRDMREPL